MHNRTMHFVSGSIITMSRPPITTAGLFFFIVNVAAVAAASSDSMPLAGRDILWEDLKSQLSSDDDDMLIATTNQDYVDQCYPEFKKPAGERTHHNLVDQPSGLCMNQISTSFQHANPMSTSNPNMTMDEVVKATMGLGVELGTAILTNVSIDESLVPDMKDVIDPSNPAYNLPPKVLFPKVAGDVAAAVQFAMENNVELSVKASGHSYSGSSTKKDTLLLNMRRFKEYSSTVIVECGNQDDDEIDEPCRYALARNVPAYIRVGGGEGWGSVYINVKKFNEAQEDGYKYHAVGGAAGTVSPMGWTWQGGLSGTNGGRMYGFGVDQVLQIEAVLPNGYHVRFGPTEWEGREGSRYPQVTAVSGVCNENPSEEDESKWNWTACPAVINFGDLWFGFLGGGGGTYGIITSVSLQLHEYPGQVTDFPYDNSHITKNCGVPQEYLKAGLEDEVWSFLLDFLLDPAAVNVSEEDSNACGGPPTKILWCYGENAAEAFATAWENYFVGLKDGAFPDDREEIPDSAILALSRCMKETNEKGPHNDYAETIVISDGDNAGKALDSPRPEYSHNYGNYPILIPKSWMLDNKDKVIKLLVETGESPYLAFGGVAATAQDSSTVSLSDAHREAGMILFLGPEVLPIDMLNDMYNFPSVAGDGDFPAYISSNLYTPYIFGPLKNDTSMKCDLMNWTRQETNEYCVEIQILLYGSKNLARLESIKESIDPNYMLDCDTCIGNNRDKTNTVADTDEAEKSGEDNETAEVPTVDENVDEDEDGTTAINGGTTSTNGGSTTTINGDTATTNGDAAFTYSAASIMMTMASIHVSFVLLVAAIAFALVF